MADPHASISTLALSASFATPNAPRVFDVRRRKAFDEAERIIATARWRDHRQVDLWAPSLAGDGPVVVYCVHGHQVSQCAAAALRARGVVAFYLDGGIEGFVAGGGIAPERAPLAAGSDASPSRWLMSCDPTLESIGCAWLILRFIDPDARIFCAEDEWAEEVGRELEATPMGFAEGHWGNVNALLGQFGIENAALTRVARMVRGSSGLGTGVEPEAAGLVAAATGLAGLYPDALERLEHCMVILDSLYRWCRGRADP